MKKIAIVSCDKWKDKILEDKLILQNLLSKGYDASIISWEDNSIDFKQFDVMLLRSVWGYQNKYSEFKKWLIDIKNNSILLLNDADIVLSNIRKDIQFKVLDISFCKSITDETVLDLGNYL